MAITAHFLKAIMAEARPIIERQMDDAKLISGFQKVVSAAGGDWGALKALIKAHVEDEADEAGDRKRVKKIVDKADDTAAYADMLGLANMNENNFSGSQSYTEAKSSESTTPKASIPKASSAETADLGTTPYDPSTGEITEQEQPGEPATNPVANVGEGANGAIAAAPCDPASRDDDGTDLRQSVSSGFTGEGDGRDVEASGGAASVTTDSPSTAPAVEPEAAPQAPQSASGEVSDADIPAFIKRDYVLRPHCLNPSLCAGSGSKHCHACLKARDESILADEVAA